MITTLRRTWPSDGFTSDCWCPVEAGACRPPYDLQPASLTRRVVPLDVVGEAAVVLSGSILEHLRADRTSAATRQLDHLAVLVDLA